MRLAIILFLFSFGFLSSGNASNQYIVHQQVKERDVCNELDGYFNSIQKGCSADEVVVVLSKARTSLVEQGYEVPLLSALFERTFEGVKGHGVFLDEGFIEDFYEKILLHEEELTTEASFQALTDSLQRPRTMMVKKRKHKKDIQVPDGVAIGFCKALAGGLLCIIPTGITQTIGTGLVLSGVNDMIQHAKDPINDSSGNWEQDLKQGQKMNHENVSQTLPERVSSRLHGITQV